MVEQAQASQGPRALAMVLAQAAFGTPSGNLNIIEVLDTVQTWVFPQRLPPLVAVCILVGGQPAQVYTTRWALMDKDRNVIGEMPGPDIPFTTQIKRVNILQNIQEISANEVVIEASRFFISLAVSGTPVTETTLEIKRIPQPGGTQ